LFAKTALRQKTSSATVQSEINSNDYLPKAAESLRYLAQQAMNHHVTS
jgi:hypothetical protein